MAVSRWCDPYIYDVSFLEFKRQEREIIMHTGMLWFDNSPSPLADKIRKAADYYAKKYGRTPNLCLVHPSALVGIDVAPNAIEIRPYRPVLPGHIWIGVEDEPSV